MRERLIAELQLTDSQQAKLDAIMAELRPRFIALAELEQAARQPARAKLLVEMQQKINTMLTPDQRATYEQIQARAAANREAQGAAGAGAASAGAGARLPAARQEGGAVAASAPPAAGVAAKPVPSSGAGRPLAPSASAAAGADAAAAAPGPVAPALPGAGPLQDFRNRLVTELKLGADQAAKVDGVIADARPRFMTLRDLPAEERPKARDRIMADLRARVGDMLTPEQKTRYATLLADAGGRANTRGRIYLLGADGKPKAFNVRLGISDGSSTELLLPPGGPTAAEVREGASVIIGVQAPASGSGRSTPAGGPRPLF